MLHDIKITSPDMPHSSNVIIDGEQSAHVMAVRFEIMADKFAAVELKVLAQHFEYEGKSTVGLDKPTKALLVKLGWTPPE